MEDRDIPPAALARLEQLQKDLIGGENVALLVTFMTKDGNVGFNSFGGIAAPAILGMLAISQQIVLDSLMGRGAPTPEQPRLTLASAMPKLRQ
jgi:hypothetical protein